MTQPMRPMRARHYASIAPLDTEPIGPYTEPAQREEALRDALRGVELGSHDERIVAWALRAFDNSTMRVLVSWLERARGAGMVEVLETETIAQRTTRAARARQEIRERERHAADAQRQAEDRGVPRNSGDSRY